MPITNTWTITKLDCYPQQGENTDVVFTSHWTLEATDGTHTGRTYGIASVTYDENEPFVPYAELTEAQVLSWTLAALGEAQITVAETEVAQQIQVQANPPSVTPPLPWTVPAAAPVEEPAEAPVEEPAEAPVEEPTEG
jgi:hypothetical protein